MGQPCDSVRRPVLLPVPFHWVYVPALYFDNGIYRWIFCATVVDIRAVAANLGCSGLQKDDSDEPIAAANLNSQISKKKTRLKIRSNKQTSGILG